MDVILLVYYISFLGVGYAREYSYPNNNECVKAARVLKSRVKVGKVFTFCNRRKI